MDLLLETGSPLENKKNTSSSISFAEMLDEAPIGIHCVDAKGNIQWANRTQLNMLGYEPDEYIGHPVAKFHVNTAVLDSMMQQLQRGQSIESREVRLWHKNGSMRIGAVSSNAVWEDGKFIHTRCFTRDITGTIEDGKIKETLYLLIDRLQRATSLQHVYDAALIAIETSLQCHRSSILLFDDTKYMRFVASRGLSAEYQKSVDGHSPWTLDSVNPAPITIDDAETTTLLNEDLKRIVKHEGIRALAFIPLVSDGKIIGKFMTYFDTPFKFGPDQIDLCLSIARQVSFSVARKQAELALATTELNFREMIDALPAAVYTTDAMGQLTHFNPAAALLAGRTPERGKDRWSVCWKLYQPDGTPLAHEDCPMAVALKQGRSIRDAEAILERPNGERRWFTPFPTPVKDAKGKVIGGINMLVDITERKRTEQALAQHASQLALVTNIAPVYIAQCDKHSRYQFVNEPHAQRFGMNAIDLKGRHISDVLGADAYAVIKPHVESVLQGNKVEFDMTLLEPGRGERFVHCWYVPDTDINGVVMGFVAAVADITERRRIEQALRDREDELKEADRRKDEFLAMLSHELRNPLAPIANAVHILRTVPADSSVFTQARAIIERQTARLARLVDDLLEVSRISTGRIKLNMERVAAKGIFERSIESVRPLIDQHRHSLSVLLPEQNIWLDADSARLEQVFVNLLTNACKYTNDGGSIELEAKIEKSRLIVTIRDNGIGIPAELLPRVFDLFTQAERTLDRSQGGLGIGLALVNSLVSMHAGTVTAESIEKIGSMFTVTLPIADAPVFDAKVQLSASSETMNSLRILIADDNNDAAKSLAILLDAGGHRTWIAHDGKQALQLAGQCQPHIAFLDIGLPEMDGYTLVKQLRETSCPDTVCVAITGYGQSTDRERALLAGFNEHLVKPVDFGTLERFINNTASQVAKPS